MRYLFPESMPICYSLQIVQMSSHNQAILSVDALSKIFLYIDCTELCTARHVCKLWNQTLEDSFLWKQISNSKEKYSCMTADPLSAVFRLSIERNMERHKIYSKLFAHLPYKSEFVCFYLSTSKNLSTSTYSILINKTAPKSESILYEVTIGSSGIIEEVFSDFSNHFRIGYMLVLPLSVCSVTLTY